MEKDNKETIFEIITVVTALIGAYFGNEYLLIAAMFPISVALWFWYNDNLVQPLVLLKNETKELRKDLNMRKEIEDMKMQMSMLSIKIAQTKKGGVGPFWLIAILAIIIIIMMYLRDKGFI